MAISDESLDELRELLARHEQGGDCQRTGRCCASLLIELLEELLED